MRRCDHVPILFFPSLASRLGFSTTVRPAAFRNGRGVDQYDNVNACVANGDAWTFAPSAPLVPGAPLALPSDARQYPLMLLLQIGLCERRSSRAVMNRDFTRPRATLPMTSLATVPR